MRDAENEMVILDKRRDDEQGGSFGDLMTYFYYLETILRLDIASKALRTLRKKI